MVLQGGPCGRVDRRRTQFIKALFVNSSRAFFIPRREHAKEISQIQCFFDTLLT